MYCTENYRKYIKVVFLETAHYFLKFINDISSVISRTAKTKTKLSTSSRHLPSLTVWRYMVCGDDVLQNTVQWG